MYRKRYLFLLLTALMGLAISIYVVSRSMTFQFFGEVYNRVNTSEKVIALTFDDGPSEKAPEILQLLDQHNIKATFFLTGAGIQNNFQETESIVKAGHEIGNHSYSHKRMVFKSYAYVKEEIEKTDALIKKAGYDLPTHYRPAYGLKLLTLPYYLSKHNRKTIMWNIGPESNPDLADDPDKMADYIIEKAIPGSIILLHPMYDDRIASIQALPKVLNGLKAKGFTFKTVSELLEYNIDSGD